MARPGRILLGCDGSSTGAAALTVVPLFERSMEDVLQSDRRYQGIRARSCLSNMSEPHQIDRALLRRFGGIAVGRGQSYGYRDTFPVGERPGIRCKRRTKVQLRDDTASMQDR